MCVCNLQVKDRKGRTTIDFRLLSKMEACEPLAHTSMNPDEVDTPVIDNLPQTTREDANVSKVTVNCGQAESCLLHHRVAVGVPTPVVGVSGHSSSLLMYMIARVWHGRCCRTSHICTTWASQAQGASVDWDPLSV